MNKWTFGLLYQKDLLSFDVEVEEEVDEEEVDEAEEDGGGAGPSED